MFQPTTRSTTSRSALMAALALVLSGCAGTVGSPGGVALGPDAVAGKTPDGTVDMQEVQAAYIGSGSTGSGTLMFRGQQYSFQVNALGVGGIGLSTVNAAGEVYNLRDLAQFPGTYGQARYGFAIGSTSAGDLWMQNEQGVILHLKAKRTGLMLSLGGDAVVISMTPP